MGGLLLYGLFPVQEESPAVLPNAGFRKAGRDLMTKTTLFFLLILMGVMTMAHAQTG
ncbi:MAG: hypothetical protein JWN14_1972, partial [Chthonomonadales bacterium]|nr:hypothetical protein [Chthonomonadales bacterium]